VEPSSQNAIPKFTSYKHLLCSSLDCLQQFEIRVAADFCSSQQNTLIWSKKDRVSYLLFKTSLVAIWQKKKRLFENLQPFWSGWGWHLYSTARASASCTKSGARLVTTSARWSSERSPEPSPRVSPTSCGGSGQTWHTGSHLSSSPTWFTPSARRSTKGCRGNKRASSIRERWQCSQDSSHNFSVKLATSKSLQNV